jgi:hypothetical protein
MEKKIYFAPFTEVISVETESFIANSPVIFDGGQGAGGDGQGVNADDVTEIGG